MDIYCQPSSDNTYTGVFVVDTPAVDHSGVSHLTEHMCFRASSRFPADHELFAANALLPISINASTSSNRTYYFVTSDFADLFLAGVDMVCSGLLNQHYSKASFIAERDGVLFHELSLLESNPDYQRNLATRLGDCGSHAYTHAGGMAQTINEISFAEFTHYKDTHYHPQNISFLCAGPDAALDTQCRQLITPLCASPRARKMPVNYPTRQGYKCLSRESDLVTTWWIPAGFYAGLQPHESAIKQDLSAIGHCWLDPEVNSQGYFALRMMHRQWQPVEDKVVEQLKGIHVAPVPAVFDDPKLPTQVKHLINRYKPMSSAKIGRFKTFGDYLKHPQVSYVAKLANHLTRPSHPSIHGLDTHQTSSLVQRYQHRASLANVPRLPLSLHSLAGQTSQGSPFSYHNGLWVFQVTRDCHHLLIYLLSRAGFWLPRITGECYALGVGQWGGEIFLFGAQDRLSAYRGDWCQRWLNHPVTTLEKDKTRTSI